MMRRQPARTGRPSDAHAARARGYGHRAPPPSRSARRWAAPAPRNTPPPRHSRRWAWRWPTPVVATVLAAVLDQPQPGLARLQGAPQILVGLRRHVRVTDDVMRLADQLFAGEAADLDEGGIGIENPAFGVSARDEVLILTQLGFHIVDGRFTRTASLLLLHTEKSDSMTAARRARAMRRPVPVWSVNPKCHLAPLSDVETCFTAYLQALPQLTATFSKT